MPGEVIVGAIAVTLDRAAKVQRDKFVQTLRLPSRVPLKEHIFTRSMRHPQITLTGFAVSRIEVFDRRSINLDAWMCWSVGALEGGSIGVLECWSVGVLERWSVGGLEGWRVGGLESSLDASLLFH